MNDTIVWIVAVAIIGFILYSRFGGSSTSSGTWMEDLKQQLSGWMPTGQTPWPWLGYGAMALSVGYVLYWAHRKLKTDLFLYKVCMRQNQEYGWDRECPGQMAAAIDQVVGGLWDNFFPVVAGLIIGGFGSWKWWGRKMDSREQLEHRLRHHRLQSRKRRPVRSTRNRTPGGWRRAGGNDCRLHAH